jgi:hypothetical protein
MLSGITLCIGKKFSTSRFWDDIRDSEPDVWKRFQDRFGIDTVAEFFNSTEGVFGLINVVRGTSCPWFETLT